MNADSTVALTTATLISATFYMCYGNSGITTYQGSSANTWDSNFQSVWHFANGTNLSAKDSTSHAVNGTITAATATTGQIDGAANFSNATIAVNSMSVAAGSLTFSFWINSSNITGLLFDSATGRLVVDGGNNALIQCPGIL